MLLCACAPGVLLLHAIGLCYNQGPVAVLAGMTSTRSLLGQCKIAYYDFPLTMVGILTLGSSLRFDLCIDAHGLV